MLQERKKQVDEMIEIFGDEYYDYKENRTFDRQAQTEYNKDTKNERSQWVR